MILLDTSAMIEILNDTEKRTAIEELCRNRPVTISTVTLNELLIGKNHRRTLNQLKKTHIIGFDQDIAVQTAEIERALSKQGNPIGKLDAFIAGTAVTHNLHLVTLDKGFRRVPGLDVTVV